MPCHPRDHSHSWRRLYWLFGDWREPLARHCINPALDVFLPRQGKILACSIYRLAFHLDLIYWLNDQLCQL